MTEKEIQKLASKFLNGTASEEEEAMLHNWYDKQGFTDEEVTVITHGEDREEVKQRLYAAISSTLEKERRDESAIRRTAWMPYAAAVLFFLSVGIYFFFIKDSSEEAIHYTQLLKNDVGPGGENAILELGNGEEINLDSTKVGDIVSFEGVLVNKTADGILSLDVTSATRTASIQQNTIRTPKGGYFQLKLPDGTLVWLNASSSIRFPAIFADDLREIYLEGEAYFEVAKLKNTKNQQVPFVVKTAKQQINVLGTSFNVNSYPNETAEYTTLLEGSVSILPIGTQSAKLLQPGEQSIIQNNEINIQTADMESAFAWKNGDFIFNHENLYNIMKKIERWYDVEVVYQEVDQNRTFSGAISRSRNLSEVLHLMEMTGKVTFKIEGRRVLVMT